MISDAMLQQAAEELATAINESLPDPKECVFQFSPKFERKMKRLTIRFCIEIYGWLQVYYWYF